MEDFIKHKNQLSNLSSDLLETLRLLHTASEIAKYYIEYQKELLLKKSTHIQPIIIYEPFEDRISMELFENERDVYAFQQLFREKHVIPFVWMVENKKILLCIDDAAIRFVEKPFISELDDLKLIENINEHTNHIEISMTSSIKFNYFSKIPGLWKFDKNLEVIRLKNYTLRVLLQHTKTSIEGVIVHYDPTIKVKDMSNLFQAMTSNKHSLHVTGTNSINFINEHFDTILSYYIKEVIKYQDGIDKIIHMVNMSFPYFPIDLFLELCQ